MQKNTTRNCTSGLYTIEGMVFFNGGLFAEVHTPSPAQKLLVSKYTGPFLQLLTTKKGFLKTVSSLFGPDMALSSSDLDLVWDMNAYKNGFLTFHRQQNYVIDRRLKRDRYVNALVTESDRIPIRHINGPYDSIAGRHMAERYLEVVPTNRADIVYCSNRTGHYPHIEALGEVTHYLQEFFDIVHVQSTE